MPMTQKSVGKLLLAFIIVMSALCYADAADEMEMVSDDEMAYDHAVQDSVSDSQSESSRIMQENAQMIEDELEQEDSEVEVEDIADQIRTMSIFDLRIANHLRSRNVRVSMDERYDNGMEEEVDTIQQHHNPPQDHLAEVAGIGFDRSIGDTPYLGRGHLIPRTPTPSDDGMDDGMDDGIASDSNTSRQLGDEHDDEVDDEVDDDHSDEMEDEDDDENENAGFGEVFNMQHLFENQHLMTMATHFDMYIVTMLLNHQVHPGRWVRDAENEWERLHEQVTASGLPRCHWMNIGRRIDHHRRHRSFVFFGFDAALAASGTQLPYNLVFRGPFVARRELYAPSSVPSTRQLFCHAALVGQGHLTEEQFAQQQPQTQMWLQPEVPLQPHLQRIVDSFVPPPLSATQQREMRMVFRMALCMFRRLIVFIHESCIDTASEGPARFNEMYERIELMLMSIETWEGERAGRGRYVLWTLWWLLATRRPHIMPLTRQMALMLALQDVIERRYPSYVWTTAVRWTSEQHLERQLRRRVAQEHDSHLRRSMLRVRTMQTASTISMTTQRRDAHSRRVFNAQQRAHVPSYQNSRQGLATNLNTRNGILRMNECTIPALAMRDRAVVEDAFRAELARAQLSQNAFYPQRPRPQQPNIEQDRAAFNGRDWPDTAHLSRIDQILLRAAELPRELADNIIRARDASNNAYSMRGLDSLVLLGLTSLATTADINTDGFNSGYHSRSRRPEHYDSETEAFDGDEEGEDCEDSDDDMLAAALAPFVEDNYDEAGAPDPAANERHEASIARGDHRRTYSEHRQDARRQAARDTSIAASRVSPGHRYDWPCSRCTSDERCPRCARDRQ